MASHSAVALVSGANRGIGRAVATSLAKDHGYTVLIGSRNLADGEEVAQGLRAEGYKAQAIQLDLTSDESIHKAADVIDQAYGRLDVLVNNAAVLLDRYDERKPDLTPRELFRQTFEINVFGTAILTDALLPLLRKAAPGPPRVVFVSTRMASMAEGTNREMPFFFVDFKAYDSSKSAANMLALNYARLLEDVGGLVNVVCPGFVSTGLNFNNEAALPTEVGAQRIVEMATLDKNGAQATFTDKDGPIPW
ncbi:hypothetical protein PG984_012236 [Apiospora sp. TS-2023a]